MISGHKFSNFGKPDVLDKNMSPMKTGLESSERLRQTTDTKESIIIPVK